MTADEVLALHECLPALKRRGRLFARAPRARRGPAVDTTVVARLVTWGLLEWINRSHTAAKLTPAGKEARR